MSLNLEPIESPPFRALVADDQPDILEALRVLLKMDGCELKTVSSTEGILQALAGREFDVLLMDLNYARDTTSGREGLDVLAEIRELDPTLPIVAMTAWSTIDLAVESMRRGVGDFVRKPWENDRLMATLRVQVERGKVRRARRLREAARQRRDEERASRLQRRDQELNEAGEVQRAQLPRSLPRLDGYELSGTWRPARAVGGDLFDFFPIEGDAIGICIADAAGKGLPAALIMSSVHAAVEAVAESGAEPDVVCAKVNRLLCRHMAASRYVTCFYGRLEPRRRHLSFTNAGHHAPILMHADGTHQRLTTGGGVLGSFPQWQYLRGEVALRSGDRLVLFTDGLTEATNAEGVEFGEERIVEVVRANRSLSAAVLEARVMDSVAQFGDGVLQDDATLAVLSVED
jgi:sigma-B regulation protein RsbU (phosphoserine phosphatase)